MLTEKSKLRGNNGKVTLTFKKQRLMVQAMSQKKCFKKISKQGKIISELQDCHKTN